MAIFQCNLIERREAHIKIEASDKKEAAKKAFDICCESGKQYMDMVWYGPEESDYDPEIEVTMALEDGPPYWDEVELIAVEET